MQASVKFAQFRCVTPAYHTSENLPDVILWYLLASGLLSLPSYLRGISPTLSKSCSNDFTELVGFIPHRAWRDVLA